MVVYDPLTFATREVIQFDAVMEEHRAAIDRRDCEDSLQIGIVALRWLERAAETVIEAENDCLVPYSEEVHAAIQRLYEAWLQCGERAEATIGGVIAAGHTPDNLAEFHDCCSRARRWLATQAGIRAATLPHGQLAEYARHLAE